MGKLNLPGLVPDNASSLYARNLLAFVELLIGKESKAVEVPWEDDIVKGTLIARDGTFVHPLLQSAAKPAAAPAKPKAKANGNGGAKPTKPKGGKA
jgi:H+-translocating NAD(P) transhydrogenase subunit alpha